MSELLRNGNYIDGHWSSGGATYAVTDPASGELITQVQKAGAEETRLAIAAAERALPAWRGLTAKERGQRLRRWAELMLGNQRELATLMCREQGKPLAEALGEVVYAASFLEWFAEEAKRAYGDVIPSHKADARIVVVKEAIGVVAAITPWNFPLAMVTRKVGPALAAGCTMILKPSEETPLSAFALAVLAEQAGIPAGVFNIVSGNAVAIGGALQASSVVRKLSFTGSTRTGKLLMRQAADTLKKVSLELGGNAPFIVFDDADLDAAVKGAMASKFRNTGQTFNGPKFEGAGLYDVNTRNGQRCSSSFAHLHPALGRPNLKVEHHALVDRVLFDAAGQRAIGVLVNQNGVNRSFTARKEVILCAGAVDTPKILQLSGVGDRELLQRHGIAQVRQLPAVGRNLQDHLCVSYYYKANVPTLNDELSSLLGQLKLGIRYLLTRKGALAMSVNQAGGFFRGNDEEQNPNLQLYFNPLSYQIPKNNKASLKPEPYSGFLLCFNPCRPTSRGHVEIASGNPRDAALIDPNYLSTEKDRDEAIQGSRLMRKIMQAPALKGITVEEVLPGPAVESDEHMLAYFRENCGSIYHLCGSCAMGADEETSVVDRRLKVHGLDGLRIVDASIFPNVTSGNTHAAVLMVAEKGADLILADA